MTHEVVWARRWERKRRLLPRLRLSYPNDLESQKLCDLARVDDGPAIFISNLRSIILDAHLDDLALRGLSVPEVRIALKKVTVACESLRGALSAIDVGTGGSAERAGILLEIELASDDSSGQTALIPECLEFLDRVNNAATKAAEGVQSKRGPKGTAGSPAFGFFVVSIQTAAWQRGGDWTNYRSTDGSWTGTLLQAIEILTPYLPKDFLPQGETRGRAVEYIRKRLKDHITKNRPSPE
jgi:hypothetical protein